MSLVYTKIEELFSILALCAIIPDLFSFHLYQEDYSCMSLCIKLQLVFIYSILAQGLFKLLSCAMLHFFFIFLLYMIYSAKPFFSSHPWHKDISFFFFFFFLGGGTSIPMANTVFKSLPFHIHLLENIRLGLLCL